MINELQGAAAALKDETTLDALCAIRSRDPGLVKTAAERKAEERARRRKEGLRPFEVWAHPSDWPLIKRLVERVSQNAEKRNDRLLSKETCVSWH